MSIFANLLFATTHLVLTWISQTSMYNYSPIERSFFEFSVFVLNSFHIFPTNVGKVFKIKLSLS